MPGSINNVQVVHSSVLVFHIGLVVILLMRISVSHSKSLLILYPHLSRDSEFTRRIRLVLHFILVYSPYVCFPPFCYVPCFILVTITLTWTCCYFSTITVRFIIKRGAVLRKMQICSPLVVPRFV